MRLFNFYKLFVLVLLISYGCNSPNDRTGVDSGGDVDILSTDSNSPGVTDSDTDTDTDTDTQISNPSDGTPCGWGNKGKILNVTDDIELCLPKTICNMETCQADLGTCENGIDGECTYKSGYDGLKTNPEAWATWYCQLTDTGGCQGTIEYATTEVREAVKAKLGIPYCFKDKSSTCLGIVALSPLMGGNSRLAKDSSGNYLSEWGLGLTPASGLCYEIEGSTGKKAVVAITDRCAGYCDCGSGMEECGNCMVGDVPEPDEITPGCPCIGTVPSLGAGGETCAAQQTCDWCMSNSHPHFDLDVDTFNHICDEDAVMGSCKMKSVKVIECMTPAQWPCPAGSGFCFGDGAVGRIPGTYCCSW
ncbi:MAG: hypothetical protein JXR91_10880 [Deltaproteobacteria bacterium]|nr:hypothetical protein [Deltaproteobacteria bacterium]